METIDSYKNKFHQHVCLLQDKITRELHRLDPALALIEDPWERVDHAGQSGGGGRTRAFQGEVFENAGVNTSCVYGKIDPQFAAKLQGSGDEMWAAGISLIIHPRNPRVPTVHANFRMIQQGPKVWFGGGADLTPFYPHEEDFRFFHRTWQKASGAHYDWMKKECDSYFTNVHRGAEMRGIGGLFFDGYNTGDMAADFKLVTELSEFFIPSYFPLVEKRMQEKFDAADEEFQLHRRGRYVEFNLLHDRGTLFGLKTNGRVDSILISLPARCKYTYRYAPPADSPHARMMEYYRPGLSWV